MKKYFIKKIISMNYDIKIEKKILFLENIKLKKIFFLTINIY